ncbi:MAG: YicC/YloC family endoribonuclease [Opitutales bacterium]|nr:YicC/YloC family endoribonuclease [Opitutales bacterium]
MIKSMTGFGGANAEIDAAKYEISVLGINRKGFEFASSLPRELAVLEPKIAALAKENSSRGRVYVCVQKVQNIAEVFDENAFAQTLLSFQELCKKNGILCNIDSQTVLALSEKCRLAQHLDADEVFKKLLPHIKMAFKDFNDMREKEGLTLRGDFLKRLEKLLDMQSELANLSKDCVQLRTAQILERLNSLKLGVDEKDPAVMREIVLYADKTDISEELTRILSHITQFKSLLDSDETVGRKLDFLCQELFREINTLSSKAAKLECVNIAVDFKNELERIREQVQNVE